MKLANLKIGAKLGASFALVVLITSAIGLFAVFQLSRINANTVDMAENWGPGVELAGNLRITATEFRLAQTNWALSSDSSSRDKARKRVDELQTQLGQLVAAYEKQLASDEEREAFTKFQQDLTIVNTAHGQFLARPRGTPSDEDHVQALLQSELEPAFVQMVTSMAALSRINSEGTQSAYAQAQKTYAQSRAWLIALVVAAIALAATLAVWVTRLVTRPLAEALAAAEQMAAGDLSGHMQHEGRDEVALLLQALARMRERFVQIVAGVRQNAESVATASAEISQGNNDLSGRTEQQASALQETAASMEQLGSTVNLNADNARQANQLAMGASTVALRGGEVVSEVVHTMQGINDSSKKVVDIISVIDGIAFQTNILALNAAVEAARAGEQGRGFAVVAGEVRTLAQRSAEAAKEIKTLISDSVERVEQGTQLVDRAGETMQEVVTAIRRVTDIVGEISSASTEQSAGVAQVGEAIMQMDQATQQNAALVEQSAAAAESLKHQAQQLVSSVAVFKLGAHAETSTSTAPPSAVPVATKSTSASAPLRTERRGPNRATNVLRPNFSPPAAVSAPAQSSSTTAKSGTHDDWETF